MLGDHPAWAAAIRERDPRDDSTDLEAMGTAFVYETLRLHGSPYIYRVVTREGRLGSYRLPRGWLVRLCVREAHRRPEVLPDPERFDPSRFMGRHYEPSEFLPFSDGAHACFADALSIAVARAMILELARAYDVRTVVDGPAEGGNRHWDFWRPSRRWRITMTSCAP
jgi:cytochrome P450